MSAYLKFFQLEKSPFDTRAQSNLVLGTQALRSAFAEIEAGLSEGAPRICVDGKSGLGKTSLARALPKLLGDRARVVLILNPSLPWNTLRAAVVKQLDLAEGNLSRKTLLRARAEGRQLVIVVDQAERISSETLEHLDILLGYKTDDGAQLLHCVLLANLEAAASIHTDQGEQCPLLWWLDRLNTLQLEFHPIPASGVASYVQKHLKRAGWKGGQLFSAEAMQTIHRLTGGVPREMSELCERALELAAEQQADQVDVAMVETCFGEIPLEEAVGGGSDRDDLRGPASTDDRSEFERTVPTPGTKARATSGGARAASVDRTAPAFEDDDDPRIDRMPGAVRRGRAASDGPLSLDSFFGDSVPGDPVSGGSKSGAEASPGSTPSVAAAGGPGDRARDEADSGLGLDASEGERTDAGRSAGWKRTFALAAGVVLAVGAVGAVGMALFGGATDDGASSSTAPAVLARPKPTRAAEAPPLAGMEPAFDVGATAPRARALGASASADGATGAATADGPGSGASTARTDHTVLPALDRTTDEGPDPLDDLEQALVGPAAPADAESATDANAPARSAPAAPAPGGWKNPADAEIEAPYW